MAKQKTGAPRRSALVTGASYGIGAAAAIALAEDGCDVAITDLNPEDLADTAARITGAGGRAVPIPLDVRADPSIDAAFAMAIARLGKLDVLVNNAGVPSPGKPVVDLTRAEWDRIMAVNLAGVFFMSQRMGRHLIGAGRPGVIISLASTHGMVGLANASAYGISKAGVSQMTRMLAIEWAKHGIRVNAIGPGATETKTRAPRLADPKHRKLMLDRVPAGRFGTAEEMGAAICYLASDKASYITGQTLMLDGGLTAQ